MATAEWTGETAPIPMREGFCVGSAMVGGALGAMAGAAPIGHSFEYAAVLVGTLGVVLGSVIAGTAGRYIVFPAFRAVSGRRE